MSGTFSCLTGLVRQVSVAGMGRSWRAAAGGYVYHVLNRANARLRLFHKDGDYEAFERVLGEARQLYDLPVLAYCVLPNHWHRVLWPRADGDLSRFVGWLTLTHTQRWHAHYHTVGAGHAYQGRFKSFPVQEDQHLLAVCRYVERNALRAGLVSRAEDWRWGSLWRRQRGSPEAQALLGDWPVPRPGRWAAWVNEAQCECGDTLDNSLCCMRLWDNSSLHACPGRRPLPPPRDGRDPATEETCVCRIGAYTGSNGRPGGEQVPQPRRVLSDVARAAPPAVDRSRLLPCHGPRPQPRDHFRR